MKQYDIFATLLQNTQAKPEDLITSGLSPDNTELRTKDEYKNSELIKTQFTDINGKFDESGFDSFYDIANTYYQSMSDTAYLEQALTVPDSPLNINRKIGSKTYDTDTKFMPDFNPDKSSYNLTHFGSIDPNELSRRELAQRNKVFDTKTNEWSEKPLNDFNVFSKFLGDTLVYAAWDEDGTHYNKILGREVSHKSGDWKYDDTGNYFTETIGDREIYNKQVVNPSDLLTTEGTLMNKVDFFDSDGRTKNILGATLKMGVGIAPFLIPGVGQAYAGLKVFTGLASAMPTFAKSFEAVLTNENNINAFTQWENYTAKFKAKSFSDKNEGSLWNAEQMVSMVGDIFSQLYEQRAAASVSTLFSKAHKLEEAKRLEIAEKLGTSAMFRGLSKGITDKEQLQTMASEATKRLPEILANTKSTSTLSKGLSLGYMALTSTADVFSETLESGYDRRVAGFAALASASGMYALMTNNRMGEWFLDKSVGFNPEVSRTTMNKAVKEYTSSIAKAMDKINSGLVKEGKKDLGKIFSQIHSKGQNLLTPSALGESLVKNAVIESIEEVTEEVTMDAVKGVVDTISYLGLLDKKGSFGGWSNVFSLSGLERYAAAAVGGFLGGSLFELQRLKIEPALGLSSLSGPEKYDVYEYVSRGHKDLLIKEINRNRSLYGNKYISAPLETGEIKQAELGLSQGDIVADMAIKMIEKVDNIMTGENLKYTEDELIEKVVRDTFIIEDLREASKNGLGIEGIIVEDFVDITNKLVDINANMDALKSQNSELDLSQMEKLRDDLRTQRDQILNGDNSLEYIKRIGMYLSKSISKHYITPDIQSFTLERYKVAYDDLSTDKGVYLNKKRVEKEFADFKNSTDFRPYLDLAVRLYERMEKKSFKTIEEYAKNYTVLKQIQNKVLFDLERTIDRFSGTDLQSKIDQYKAVVNLLRENGASITEEPWMSYHTDLAESIVDGGSLRFIKVEEDGKVVTMTAEEQEKLLREDKLVKQATKDALDYTIKSFPTNNFDINLIIDLFNEIQDSHIDDAVKTPGGLKYFAYVVKPTKVNLTHIPNIEDTLKSLFEQVLVQNVDVDSDDLVKIIIEGGYLEKGINILINNINSIRVTKGVSNPNLIVQLLDKMRGEDGKTMSLKDAKSTLISYIEQVRPQLDNLVQAAKPIKLKNYTKELLKNYLDNNPEDGEVNEMYRKIIKDEIFNTNEYIDPKTLLKQIESLSADLDEINGTSWESVKDMTLNSDELLELLISDDIEETKAMQFLNGYYEKFNKDTFIRNISLLKNSYSKSLNEYKRTLSKNQKYNPIFTLLRSMSADLYGSESDIQNFFSILEEEIKSLKSVDTVEEYIISSEHREKSIEKAQHLLNVLESVIKGTTVTNKESIYDEDKDFQKVHIYGYLAMRKLYAKKFEINDYVNDVEGIDSAESSLMLQDIEFLRSKLNFLKEIADGNKRSSVQEQENIRKNLTDIFLKRINEVVEEEKFPAGFKELIGSLSFDTDEEKYYEIASEVFKYFKDKTIEAKIDFFKQLLGDTKLSFDFMEFSDLRGNMTPDKLLDRDFYTQLLVMMSIDLKQYNERFKWALDSNLINKVPFFGQELAVQLSLAQIKNQELFDTFLSTFAKDSPHINFSNIVFLLGVGGAGKTTVLFKTVLAMLKKDNPNLSIWLAAPVIEQAEKLHKDLFEGTESLEQGITVNKFSKLDLFKKLNKNLPDFLSKVLLDLKKPNAEKIYTKVSEKDSRLAIEFTDLFESELETYLKKLENLPSVIFIDENSHFNVIEYLVLSKLNKDFDVKIITAGDPNQRGVKTDILHNTQIVPNYGIGIDYIYGFSNIRLLSSIRSLNSNVKSNIDKALTVQRGMKEINHGITTGNTVEDFKKAAREAGLFELYYDLKNEVLNGHLITRDLNDLKYFPTDADIGVLTKDGELSVELNAALTTLGIVDKVKKFNLNNLQGNEPEYFIFDVDLLGEDIDFDSYYTFITRAKRGTIILDKEGKLAKYGFTNTIKKSSEISPLTKELIEEATNNRKNILDKLNEGVNGTIAWLRLGSETNTTTEEPEATEESNEPSADKSLSIRLTGGIENHLKDAETLDPLLVTKDSTEKWKDNKFLSYTFYNNTSSNSYIDLTEPPKKALVADPEISKSNFNISLEKSKTTEFWTLWKAIKNGVFNIDDFASGKISFNTKINPLIEKLKVLLGNTGANHKVVLTVETYNNEYNAPRNKYKDDKLEHLQTGDKFINISLQIGDYFITLATLPALKTVEKSFVEEVYNDYKSWVGSLKVDSGKKITVISNLDLKETLTAIKPLFPTFKDVSADNSLQMRTVAEIQKYFVGGTVEVIKLPTNTTDFMNLYNNNSSHEYYDPKSLKNLYVKYGGTYAIRVSYGNRFSKIIPVFEKFHTLSQLLKVINTNKDTRGSLKDKQNTGKFLGNRLINVIQIRNIYDKLTKDEQAAYQPILTKLHSEIFKVSDVPEEVKHTRALKNIFRSHEVIGDSTSPEVVDFRIKFRNALIAEEEGKETAVDDLINATDDVSDQIKTAKKEAKIVQNFYRKLKELTNNKFYVSVILDKWTEGSQKDLTKLGLSWDPQDNLITGFIVETPKLLLNLESILKEHKKTNAAPAKPAKPAKPALGPGKPATSNSDVITQAIEDFNKDQNITKLADIFLAKEDWEDSAQILARLSEVYNILGRNRDSDIHDFQGEYNGGAIEISEDSIINEIINCD